MRNTKLNFMKHLSLLYITSFEPGFAPINARQLVNLISSNFLLIATLIISVILAAILCYFACSYIIFMWDSLMGIDRPHHQ